jgi:hypothetical protein
MTDIVQSLWIGPELSKLEQLSIKSFVDHGHKYHLYTYDEVKNVPDGAIVKDGNEILPESEIFRYKNGSVSAFSNLFRYTMLYKKGGYWADADLLCIKPLHYKEEFVFSSEPAEGYNGSNINSGLIKLPINSKEAFEGVLMQRKQKELILLGITTWGSGPATTKHIVNKFKLHKYVLPWTAICSCRYSEAATIYDPNANCHPYAITKVSQIPEEMVAIHFWNEIWRRKGVDKNGTFHPDSLFEIFKELHKIE